MLDPERIELAAAWLLERLVLLFKTPAVRARVLPTVHGNGSPSWGGGWGPHGPALELWITDMRAPLWGFEVSRDFFTSENLRDWRSDVELLMAEAFHLLVHRGDVLLDQDALPVARVRIAPEAFTQVEEDIRDGHIHDFPKA